MTAGTRTAHARETTPPARGSLRLLGDPTFGPFFVGQLLATAGVWVHNIAAAIVVYELTRSAALVGAVSIAQFGPQLLLASWSGAMADRGDRRRQVVWGRLVTVLGSGGLALWIATIGLDGVPGALAVVAAALVVGIGFALGGPAMQALIPSLVRPSELASGVTLSAAPFTLARAGGPAIGALIVTTAGPAAAFAVAAASNLAFAVLVMVLAIPHVERSPASDGSVRAGFRHIRGDGAVLALLLGACTVGIGADPVITLSPPIADALGGGSRLVGWLASAFGIGAVLAFPLLGWLRRRAGLPRMASGGLLVMAAGLGLLALAPVAWLALGAMGIAGVGITLAVTSLSTQLQQRSPEHLRGRIMAVWLIAFLGSRPLAAGVNGGIADVLSPAAALAVVVGVLVGGAWLVRPARIRRS